MSNFYKNVFELFEYKVLISLPIRTDRRRRIKKKFAELGLFFDDLRIEIFDGYRFDDANGFPNKGVRGCFTSHREVLREASKRNCKALIMEDDLEIINPPEILIDEIISFIDQGSWDVLYLGYLSPNYLDRGVSIISNTIEPTIGGHFYAVTPQFAKKIVEFMDDCENRVPGHPDGGPMYRDAAFNLFFDKNSGFNRVVIVPPLGIQFSSRTDLGKSKIFDRIPGISLIASFFREIGD